MTAASAWGEESPVGCVVTREVGVLEVLTDEGVLRASYGARMLGAIARDRSLVPGPGDWVQLRRWPDGPVTVERRLVETPPSAPPPAPPGGLADVLPLRRPRT